MLLLAKALNENNANYIVIGGMAIIQAGFVRTTGDIDILVDISHENQEKVRKAMMILPDQAIKEVRDDDLKNYSVVRVADEIVIDLMHSACGIDYKEAKKHITVITINNIAIPFAKPELLLRMKKTPREKDKLDYLYLKQLLNNKKSKQ